MEELISIANKLGGVSFATLVTLILIASRMKIWTWYAALEEEAKRHAETKAEYEKRCIDYEKRLSECRADCDRRIGRLEVSIDRWQNVALSLSGVSKEVVATMKEVSKQ